MLSGKVGKNPQPSDEPEVDALFEGIINLPEPQKKVEDVPESDRKRLQSVINEADSNIDTGVQMERTGFDKELYKKARENYEKSTSSS